MAAHSERSLRRGWMIAASTLWLLGAAGGWSVPHAWGQSITSSAPASPGEVEIWQGNTRIHAAEVRVHPPEAAPSTLSPPLLAVAPPAPLPSVRLVSPPAPPGAALRRPDPQTPLVTVRPSSFLERPPLISLRTLPILPPVPAKPVVKEEPSRAGLGQLILQTCALADECRTAISAATAREKHASEPQKITPTDLAKQPLSAVPSPNPSAAAGLSPVAKPAASASHAEPAATARKPHAVRETPPLAAAASNAANTDSSMLWLHVALVVSAGLCPLLVILTLALLLRRSGMQFRIEVVNSSPNAPIIARLEGAWPTGAAPSVPLVGGAAATGLSGLEGLPGDAPVEVAPQETAEQFDLGPTYEEEQQAKAEALRLQELAVLQEIFEQNLRLHEEIAQLDEGCDEPSPL